MESYITLKKDNKKRSFYVYNDGKAKEVGHEITIQDFAGFYLFLAGDGWRVAKEVNIPTSTKVPPTKMPKRVASRKGDFKRDWNQYLFGENSSNLS